MREVCWINARVGPSANAICDAERNIITLPNAADEEGILSTVGTGAFVFSTPSDWDPRVKGEGIGCRVETPIFGCVGCGDAV
jgi:hypothetical protein